MKSLEYVVLSPYTILLITTWSQYSNPNQNQKYKKCETPLLTVSAVDKNIYMDIIDF